MPKNEFYAQKRFSKGKRLRKMPYIEKLKLIKEEKGLTNADIAKLSDIPLATVTRVFNESTPNPTFITIISLARALGVSLDELAGFKHPDEQPLASPIIDTLSSYAELLKEKDDRIREKDNVIKELQEDKIIIRKEKYKLISVLIPLCCILTTVAILLFIDILNGNFGYFVY